MTKSQSQLLFYRAMRLAGLAPRDAWRMRSTVLRIMPDNAKVDIAGVTLIAPDQLEVPLMLLVAGGATDEYGRDLGRWEPHTFATTPPRSAGARYILPRGWAEKAL